MKKIILLDLLLTVVIIAVIIFIGIEIYGITLVADKKKNLLIPLGSSLVIHIIFLTGLVLARMALSSFITRGFFNNISASYLKRSGWMLMTYGILTGLRIVIFSGLSLKYINEYMFYITMLVAGFGLIVISDIVYKGEVIENENKLVI